jgi:hypothetical protein
MEYGFGFAPAIHRSTMVLLTKDTQKSDIELIALDDNGEPSPGTARTLRGSGVFGLYNVALVGDVFGQHSMVLIDDTGPSRCELGFFDMNGEGVIRAPSDVTQTVNDQGEPISVDDCFILGQRDGFLVLWREENYWQKTGRVHFAQRFGPDGAPSGDRFALSELGGRLDKAVSDGTRTLLLHSPGFSGTELWMLEGSDLKSVQLPGETWTDYAVTSVRDELLANQLLSSGNGADDWTLEWWRLDDDGRPRASLKTKGLKLGALGDGFVGIEELERRVTAHAIDPTFAASEGPAPLIATELRAAEVTLVSTPGGRSSLAFYRGSGPLRVVPLTCGP